MMGSRGGGGGKGLVWDKHLGGGGTVELGYKQRGHAEFCLVALSYTGEDNYKKDCASERKVRGRAGLCTTEHRKDQETRKKR
jgi:hypothetical protein